MRINTANYEASNSRKPRGDGSWLFHIIAKDGQTALYRFHGTYGEAGKSAKAAAKQIGRGMSITLCP